MKHSMLFKNAFVTKKTKRLFLSFIFLLFSILTVPNISAQDITFNVKSYKGGYNVSCNGFSDGNIDATIVGGTTPYTYSWSNGAATQDLSNIVAGVYTLTVTDAIGSSKSKSITLFEADLIEVFLTTSVYIGGYQISKMGGNDGSITTDVKGGAPPYKYLWNDGSKKPSLDKLIAGSYSVIVTDQNGCSVTKNVTLIEPTPLTATLTAATYGAYNTRCFESKDGNINLTVSGGMPPYRYNWNNGSFEEDLSNVAAGVYKVEVTDANKAATSGQITITQPNELVLSLTAFTYTNGHNISCTGCFNGSVNAVVTGGTSPFSYLWNGPGTATGQTTPGLTGVGPGGYSVEITDANGCKTLDKIFLSEPAANGWDKNGNTVDPTNFLGTTNNAPLIMKTNNIERMRISETGNVGIGTASPAFKLDVNGDINASSITTTNLNTTNFNVSNTLTSNQLYTKRIRPAVGDSIIIVGDSSIVFATNNRIYPDYSAWTTPTGIHGIAVGHPGAYGLGDYSVAMGRYARSYGKYSFAIGDFVRAQADYSIVMGSGVYVGGGPQLINNIPNSFMIGFNSNISTLFVSPSAGTGTTGAVAIGTTTIPAGFKLAVNGKIIAEELNVKLFGDWPDYVFNVDYELLPLNSLENYISENHHLPEIPSALDIQKNGINTSEIITQLVKKQEELILYIIQLNKRIASLENK